MNKYEAMFIVKPELSEEERKTALAQVTDAVTKCKGSVEQAALWSEKRRLTFPIKKHHDGIYYLVHFTAPSAAIAELRNIYKLNENILRVMFTAL